MFANSLSASLTLIAQGQWHNSRTYVLLAVILAALSISSVVGVILKRRERVG